MQSKLPEFGESIFSSMSKLAQAEGAINLAQGFPEERIDPLLIELLQKHVATGKDSYAPVIGAEKLRHEIAKLIGRNLNLQLDHDSQVTITNGAAQAIYTAITAAIGLGDEVIIFSPYYESFLPAITLNGGIARIVQLRPPEFKVDWSEVTRLINDKTKMILVNTPHNPTGTILQQQDMLELERIVIDHGLILLSDEVYHEMVYDNQKHLSALSLPGLASRSFCVYSFGKSLHVTGWKIGYCVAPPALTREFRKAHQTIVFSVNHASQLAIAEFLQLRPNTIDVKRLFQLKRDRFLNSLAASRFKFRPSCGSYFQLLDYSAICEDDDVEYAERLAREYKVAAIPISPFCVSNKYHSKMLRFCFAKSDENIDRAAEILASI
jgi:methionine transaminase